MGNLKSRTTNLIITEDLKLDPEPNYEIKTRSPRPENWKLNILRGKKEDELRGEAYAIARRKCYFPVQEFAECEKQNGLIMTSFRCQASAQKMLNCFDFECKVELDKRRRDMERNQEWWWRLYYDENGEVGDQADYKEQPWYTLKYQELTSFISKLKERSQ